MKKDIHLTYWVAHGIFFFRVGGDSFNGAVVTGSEPIQDTTPADIFAKLIEVWQPTSWENLDEPSPKRKYDHAYALGFSVISDHPEGDDVTQAMLCDAIQRRLNGLLTNNELVEACGLPYDSEEM